MLLTLKTFDKQVIVLSTNQKVQIARTISNIFLKFRHPFKLSDTVIVTRKNLRWSLNLKEGIDLAIYLLGGFELRTRSIYTKLIKPGDVVFDIGSNIGAHTLPFARLVGANGRVFSFEPTSYAFAKQQINISLNPTLGSRIFEHQTMLTATESTPLAELIYSSWPLEAAHDLHNGHQGRLMGTQGAKVSTLDSFVRNAKINRINLIKLDVDGNEHDVLLGGIKVIETYRPLIIIELAPYVFDDQPEIFDDNLKLLWSRDYEIFDMGSKNKFPHNPSIVRASIPIGGGINALAAPDAIYPVNK